MSLEAQGRAPPGQAVLSALSSTACEAVAEHLSCWSRAWEESASGKHFSISKGRNELITDCSGKHRGLWCSSSSYLAGNLPHAFQRTVSDHIFKWPCSADCCCHASDMFEMSLFEFSLLTSVFKTTILHLHFPQAILLTGGKLWKDVRKYSLISLCSVLPSSPLPHP